MRLNNDIRIQGFHSPRRAQSLRHAYAWRVMNHLPLQIGQIHDIAVSDTDTPDPRSREIQTYG